MSMVASQTQEAVAAAGWPQPGPSSGAGSSRGGAGGTGDRPTAAVVGGAGDGGGRAAAAADGADATLRRPGRANQERDGLGWEQLGEVPLTKSVGNICIEIS